MSLLLCLRCGHINAGSAIECVECLCRWSLVRDKQIDSLAEALGLTGEEATNISVAARSRATNSVLFVGPSAEPTQDNPNLIWDDSNRGIV